MAQQDSDADGGGEPSENTPGESESVRDTDNWPARDSEVPWGCSHARAVLVLGGNAVVHEKDEGPARMSHFVANEWYGPSPRFDQYNDGADAVATYKAMNPASTIFVRASDVARIQTPAGEELV